MKKILLFVLAIVISASLNSCSSDSGGGQSLILKINGVQKSYKVIAETANNRIYVYGYIGNDVNPSETVSFSMHIGDTSNPVENFVYTNADNVENDTSIITSNATLNTSSEAKGTFSGTMELGGDNLIITEGEFSVRPHFVG